MSRAIAFSLSRGYSSRVGVASRILNDDRRLRQFRRRLPSRRAVWRAWRGGQQEAEWLRTGGLYQLIHAVAAIAIMGFARGPAIMLLVGARCLRHPVCDGAGRAAWLARVTPIGGSRDYRVAVAGWLYWRG